MDWKKIYKERTCSADEAVKRIKSGDRIVMAHAAGVAEELIKALVKNHDKYKDVEIYHMLCLGEGLYMQPEYKDNFKHITSFAGGNSRKALEDGRADFYPCFFYKVPELLEKYLPTNVAFIHVSTPNEEGYCSYGISCDYTKPAAEKAALVIAQVNPNMPFIGGDNLIHVKDIDCIVEVDVPLFEIPKPKIGPVEEAIGKNCASLIQDGATLQLGIGAIPDAVLLFLKDKKDLGIHTEMFSDGIVELVKAGVVTCKEKTLHPGKLIATFLMGTKDLYEFANNNPAVELYPVDYVNDPAIIAKNDNLVSINSCIEVDLTGQVGSECIGYRQYSGTGGQVDYVRGAAMSKGGLSIMAMPSTAKKGTSSRIVPILSEGAAVTTPRNEVDYIITEYGIAHLKGKSLKERAKALIKIAHPDFKEELESYYKKRFEK